MKRPFKLLKPLLWYNQLLCFPSLFKSQNILFKHTASIEMLIVVLCIQNESSVTHLAVVEVECTYCESCWTNVTVK